MEEFLKINWRLDSSTKLENFVQDCFIKEDEIENSLVYKYLEDKTLFQPKKTPKFFPKPKGPYVPGEVKVKTNVLSKIDGWAHEQCLKALILFQSGKNSSSYTTAEKFYVEMFNKFKPIILEENAKYQDFVFHQWQNRDINFTVKIKNNLLNFGQKIWEAKWKRILLYPKFYQEIATINTTLNENESIIEYNCIKNVLELGSLAKFLKPNLICPCLLTQSALPSDEEYNCVYSRVPVSQDKNILKIIDKHAVDIVISATSLKCLTDTSDPKKRWMMPVVVKNVTVQKENGTTVSKNIVFVDKPFSQNEMCAMDFAYIAYKRLIKTTFCPFKAFSYDNTDLNDDKSTSADGIDGSSDDDIIHRNANYRIWNIKKTYCQNNLMKNNHKPVELNVLIRSKLDACELNEHGALQPVILKPKLEMQIKYGANIPSKSELAREWTSLFFTPFSNLYRVRTTPANGEVICMEKCTIQKVVAEAQAHYKYKPQLGLGILEKVFEGLSGLSPGNYLLQHLPKHEVFIAVLRECKPTDSKDVFDFYAESDKNSVTGFPKNWLPIDLNFILPSFKALNRMPGMFTPKPKHQIKKNKKKKTTPTESSKLDETKTSINK